MKQKIIICGLFIVFLLAGFCLAQQESSDTVKPGRVPGQFFYGLDRLSERAHLTLTANNLKRAQLHLNHADERLAELNEVVSKNKMKYVDKLVKYHDDELAAAEEEVGKAAALGKNTTELSAHVAAMTYKHIAVLQGVLEKVPEQAREGILRAINASQSGYANAVNRIEKETGKPADVPKPEQEQEQEQGEEPGPEMEQEQQGNGKLKMQITDKPALLNITKLEITISSVKVHTSSEVFEGETCANESYVELECENETIITPNCTNITGIIQNCTNITEIQEICTNITEEQEVCVNQTFQNQTCAEDQCDGGVFVEEECVNGTLIPGECINVSYEAPVCHNETIVTGEDCVNETVVVGQDCINTTGVIGETCVNETSTEETCGNVTKTRTICTEASGGGDAGWKVVVNASKTFDLIALKNVKEFLGETELATGKYTQIRLYISSATLQINGTTQNLTIPSGAIKLIHPFIVSPNATTTLTIDFDAEKSVHLAGSKYLMKPTIKVIAG